VLEVFRLSCIAPAENWTRSGDVGCDGRLGEALAGVKFEGEVGLFLLVDRARFNGECNKGLPSNDGAGEFTDEFSCCATFT
jgi:hypothetical protein